MSEEKLFDKEHWGPGPWRDEPDRLEFRHAGLPCLLNRGRMGCWCGYVAVSPEHPLHGHHYNDVDLQVHGGLTYAGACQGEICHVPEPGEPDDVWWFGFDCGHAFDLVPALDTFIEEKGIRRIPFPGADQADTRFRDVYRDLAYVRAETESLAEQLAAMERVWRA